MEEQKSYIPVVTILLVAVNVIVYLYTEMTGSSLETNHMIEMGAMYEPLFVRGGEYYRILTHFFLHFGAEHLGNNMISLIVLGYAIEGKIGRVRFLILYFVSGILAGFSSIVYNIITANKNVVSCGASGAIYGLLGALVVILIIKRKGIKRELPRFLLFLFLSVYSGMQDVTIDGAAHIGGLVTGFITCGFMCFGSHRLRERIRVS